MGKTKIRASILGKDINLLKNVAKRVVQNRPADVKYFSELKDFLVDSMNDKPDIVAVSVNYPHKSTLKLPKVLKMALNIPVIVFGEDQDSKTRKDISVANADFSIPGVLTAHNFWMKLVNFQKLQEKEEEERIKREEKKKQELEAQTEVNTEVEEVDLFGEINKELDESLKNIENNQMENLLDQDENSLIDSLFDKISAQEKEKEEKLNRLNIVSSKNKNKESQKSHLHWEEEESQAHASKSSQQKTNLNIISGGKSNHTHLHGEENKKEPFFPNVKKKDVAEVAKQNKKNKEQEDESKKENKEKDNNLVGSGSFKGIEVSPVEESPPLDMDDSDDRPSFADADIYNDETAEKEKVKAPKVDSKGRVKLTDKKELARREQEKQRVQKEKESEKAKNILEEACKEAIKKTLMSKTLEKPRDFTAEQVNVFTIEVGTFKGFIMISESFNQGIEGFVLDDIRTSIIDFMKSKGLVADMSSPYTISIPPSNYIEVVKESCEFTLCEEEETGKQNVLSFLEREVTLPQYEDSDKDGMITVDMKTIPPQTPVNFDAFIYLPRNKRFVRYLKEGRSLSLKQVKRHIEGDEPCKLYLPKTDKGKLIQFFIQNTISWEFSSHAETKKPA